MVSGYKKMLAFNFPDREAKYPIEGHELVVFLSCARRRAILFGKLGLHALDLPGKFGVESLGELVIVRRLVVWEVMYLQGVETILAGLEKLFCELSG
jgi:hypothetical protein